VFAKESRNEGTYDICYRTLDKSGPFYELFPEFLINEIELGNELPLWNLSI
jgi:hypothetical protein